MKKNSNLPASTLLSISGFLFELDRFAGEVNGIVTSDRMNQLRGIEKNNDPDVDMMSVMVGDLAELSRNLQFLIMYGSYISGAINTTLEIRR